jgi:hypothetical protein
LLGVAAPRAAKALRQAPLPPETDGVDAAAHNSMLLRRAVPDTAGAVVFYAENPLTRNGPDPYTGTGGILACPGGRLTPECYADSNNRLLHGTVFHGSKPSRP